MKKLLIVISALALSFPVFAIDTITDSQLNRIKVMTAYYTNRLSDTTLFPQKECPESFTVDSIVSALSQRNLSKNEYLTNCIFNSNPTSREKLDVYAYYSHIIFSEPYFDSYARKDTIRCNYLKYTMKSELRSYLEELASAEADTLYAEAPMAESVLPSRNRNVYASPQIIVDSKLMYLVLAVAGVSLIISIFLIVGMFRIRRRFRDVDMRIRNRKVSITNLDIRMDLLERKLNQSEDEKR